MNLEKGYNMKFDLYIHNFLDNFKNAKEDWNYEDGCVLLGLSYLYNAVRKMEYKEFIIKYMDHFIQEDGTIRFYDKKKYNIDNLNTGKVLFFLYDETKQDKYRLAAEHLMDQLKTHPRLKCRSFWHKKIYPNQIWLDGLYMAQPFYAEYGRRFHNKENYEDIIHQFKNVKKYMFHSVKRLHYHGFDEDRISNWADKHTGLSKNFWLRAIGWHLMALVDTMEQIQEKDSTYITILMELFIESIDGILLYQDKKSKLFYQIVDQPKIKGNYLETSGSAMVSYALLKGCQLGVLDKKLYQQKGIEIIESLYQNKLIEAGQGFVLKDICSVAGLGPDNQRDGSIQYYLSEPIVCDDHKGVGAFLMAYGTMLKVKQQNEDNCVS